MLQPAGLMGSFIFMWFIGPNKKGKTKKMEHKDELKGFTKCLDGKSKISIL